jgi:hypothetical protein
VLLADDAAAADVVAGVLASVVADDAALLRSEATAL